MPSSKFSLFIFNSNYYCIVCIHQSLLILLHTEAQHVCLKLRGIMNKVFKIFMLDVDVDNTSIYLNIYNAEISTYFN